VDGPCSWRGLVDPRSRSRSWGSPSRRWETAHRHGRCARLLQQARTRVVFAVSHVAMIAILRTVRALAGALITAAGQLPHLSQPLLCRVVSNSLRASADPSEAPVPRLIADPFGRCLRGSESLKLITVWRCAPARERPVCIEDAFRFVSAGCHHPDPPQKPCCAPKSRWSASPWPALKRSDCARFSPQRRCFLQTQRHGRHFSSRRSRRRRRIAASSPAGIRPHRHATAVRGRR